MLPSFVLAGDVKAMAAGFAHSMVLKTDGTVWATGWNEIGQLGDNSNVDKNKFVQVVGVVGVVVPRLGGSVRVRVKICVRVRVMAYGSESESDKRSRVNELGHDGSFTYY